MSSLILVSVLLLAWSNGSNDNFKGVATLFGSGVTNYRNALIWATITTFIGSLMALMLARGLVDTFKGKGIVPDVVTAQPAFLVAVAVASALTVLLASRFGLPVSTTHALTGALIGAGWLAAQGNVVVSKLASSVLLPLAFSPVISILITLVAYSVFKSVRKASGVKSCTCVCIGSVFEEVIPQPDGTLVLASTRMVVQAGERTQCVERYQGRMLGIEAGSLLDKMHFVSAGAVGLARGLNDTPKIVAILIAAQALPSNIGLALVSVTIALGGILNARRVAETLSKKITRMNPGQGFTANLVTAFLVTTASRLGLPVSTTHVSVGSLFGLGIVNRSASKNMIITILLAWVTTMPLSAFIGVIVYSLLKQA